MGAVLLKAEMQMHGFSTTLDFLADLFLNKRPFCGHIAGLVAFTPDMKNDDAEEASR